jgi:Uma2 family endonuclease
MATALRIPLLTPAEYLARERRAEVKSEFLAGRVYAMSGGTRNHSLIIQNVGGELRARLRGSRCEVLSSDMRVKVVATGLYTYPDVSVACPPVEMEDAHADTLLNPVVVVEVLSDSTEAYDRGTKAAHYRQVPSLREYLLVSQHEARIDQYVRAEGGGWTLREAAGRDAVLTLTSVGCELPLAEVYAKVEWPEPPGLRPTPPAPEAR